MFHPRFRMAVCLFVLAGTAFGQRAMRDQSPRQAVIEMFSGGEAPFKKHLTLEMQSKLQNLMKSSQDNAPNPLLALTGAKSSGVNGFSLSILAYPLCLQQS